MGVSTPKLQFLPQFIQEPEKWFLCTNSHQICLGIRGRIKSSLVWMGLSIDTKRVGQGIGSSWPQNPLLCQSNFRGRLATVPGNLSQRTSTLSFRKSPQNRIKIGFLFSNSGQTCNSQVILDPLPQPNCTRCEIVKADVCQML